MSTPIVLVIDDETQIRRALRRWLTPLSVDVVEAGSGQEGIDIAATRRPDVVVLDLGLPDMPGIDVCRELRSWSRVPILVLSARDSEADKVALLDAGADDYVTKPFGADEFTARVRAQLRRSEQDRSAARQETIRAGALHIDLVARTVTRGGVAIRLTRTEFELLRTFVTHRGRTLTHRQLFDAVWRRSHGNAQQYLRVFVTNLRRKIETDPAAPELIVTEPGVGYRFATDVGTGE